MMIMDKNVTVSVMENLLKHGKMNIPTRNAMENAVRLLKAAPEWVNCDERKPELHKVVICLIFGHDVIIRQEGESLEDAIWRTMNISRTRGGWRGSDGWYDMDGYPMVIQPSYWMEIPDAPERCDLP